MEMWHKDEEFAIMPEWISIHFQKKKEKLICPTFVCVMRPLPFILCRYDWIRVPALNENFIQFLTLDTETKQIKQKDECECLEFCRISWNVCILCYAATLIKSDEIDTWERKKEEIH